MKVWGDVVVLKDINFDIYEGEFVVFVGLLGCGKFILLCMIVGLEIIISGDLFIGDICMNEILLVECGVGMVFQFYVFYFYFFVVENMLFGLKLVGVKKDLINQWVIQVVEVLQLVYLLECKLKVFFGGQCQCVVIGCMLVVELSVFLLDELFFNFDVVLCVQMCIEIFCLYK